MTGLNPSLAISTMSTTEVTSSSPLVAIGPQALPNAASVYPADWSLADLQRHLGDIPADRIRLHPQPGTATEDDLLKINDHEERLVELIDGVLVEKTMGWYESIIASLINFKFVEYLQGHNLGQSLGADASLKLLPGIIRLPDVSFVSWDRFPKERLKRRPVPKLIPTLAVEVLSESNTKREMSMKLERYLEAGVELIWYVDPDSRTAQVWDRESPTDSTLIPADGMLSGGRILPGLEISLTWLFEQADRQTAGNPSND
jgi:Uma2 family endonuclease